MSSWGRISECGKREREKKGWIVYRREVEKTEEGHGGLKEKKNE
jgi:hypothetical protein